MNVPDVSVIVPCYNAARWLPAALDSALDQHGATAEVVVIDDGSTDDSRTTAERYAARGVRIVAQRHRGAGAARNRGLAETRGRWIQFLDADDLLGTNKLSLQCAALRTAPAQAVASCAWGRFRGGRSPDTAAFLDLEVFRDYLPAWEFLRQQARTGCMMHPAAWLLPRTLVESAGGWDESFTLNDDGEYFARILSRATEIRFVSVARTFYRSHASGSLSRRHHAEALRSLYRAALGLENELRRCDASPSTEAAVAEMWERLRFELYPNAPDLSADAAFRARRGDYRPTTRLPCGPRLKWLASMGGWKIARRLQTRFR